jgi:dienelactone hydrolase
MSQQSPGQFPNSGPFPNQPSYQQPYAAPPPKPSGVPSWVWILLGVLGTGFVSLLCVCGGLAYYASLAMKGVPASAEASLPFDVASVVAPPMPELGEWKPINDVEGAMMCEVQWGPEQDSIPSQPGMGGKMYVLLPPGKHEPASIPCLLVAPAGTNLMTGTHTAAYFESHIPYLEAGFAVMDYELDGSPEYEKISGDATRAFIDSQAGLVNARNVIDFVISKMPMVNSKHIFATGHSSGGTHVLLLGEHDTRLAGVVSYAGVCDVPGRIPASLARLTGVTDPRINDFLTQSSPNTHAARMNCPVLLCHAKDDSNVPVSDSQAMHALLQSAGKTSELHLTDNGDHYDEMLNQCIPVGIQWMKKRMNEIQ